MRFSRTISAIDAHAGGEPLRIVTSGIPWPSGATMLERRRTMLEELDHIRRLLMWEPRGHLGMYGCILTPPVSSVADYGVLFMHNEGYSTMCGHGIIALTTALLETGAVAREQKTTTITYDSPAGLIHARAETYADPVGSVTFENVASFLFARDLTLRVGGRDVAVDVVYGGAFYALVAAEALEPGLAIDQEATRRLVELGMAVKHAVEDAIDVAHPTEPELQGIYGTILTGPPQRPGAHGRNVTIFADGQVDRSPCGTGTAARVAALFARGELAVGQPYVHESILGSCFTGCVIGETAVGPYAAVVPAITGRGFITGFQQFVLDPEDDIGQGFLVR